MEKKELKKNEIELRSFLSDIKLEKRSDEENGRIISGYAAVFEKFSEPIYDWFVEQIARGAFDECDTSNVIACFNHDPNTLMARTSSGTLKLEIDEKGLSFEFEAPNTTSGNDLLENVKRGDISECSFRFIVEEDSWLYTDKDNGLKYDERTIIRFSRLVDISPVVNPAYSDTSVSARSTTLEERKKEYFRSQGKEDDNKNLVESESRNRTVHTLLLNEKM